MKSARLKLASLGMMLCSLMAVSSGASAAMSATCNATECCNTTAKGYGAKNGRECAPGTATFVSNDLGRHSVKNGTTKAGITKSQTEFFDVTCTTGVVTSVTFVKQSEGTSCPKINQLQTNASTVTTRIYQPKTGCGSSSGYQLYKATCG